MNNRIQELENLIKQEKQKIDSCKHFFGEAYYDPETKKEAYGYRTVGQGSDVWNEPEGYQDVKVPRWSRKCKVCGKIEHTYTQEAVIKEYKPKF